MSETQTMDIEVTRRDPAVPYKDGRTLSVWPGRYMGVSRDRAAALIRAAAATEITADTLASDAAPAGD